MLLPGHLTEVGPVALSTGGTVSNTGLALHILDIETKLVGKIGDDLFGDAVLQILGNYNKTLAGGMVVDPDVISSYTVVINPPGIDRLFFHCPGANDTFSVMDIDYDIVADAALFHFGYPPLMKLMYEDGGDQLSEIYRRVKEKSVTTSLDMALPDPASLAGKADWRGILEKTLPFVDIFLPSIEEILYMLRKDKYEELEIASEGSEFLSKIQPELLSEVSEEIIDMGSKIVGLKLGNQGFYLRTGTSSMIASIGSAVPSDTSAWANKELWAPCFQVEVAGTTGAGDTTIAGFLSGVLKDTRPEDAATAAVAVGSCNVEKVDALSGILPWQETMDRVDAGWSRHALVVGAAGWEYDENYELWFRNG
jgi:sugar/nucleoside kinase (ribokinase family)